MSRPRRRNALTALAMLLAVAGLFAPFTYAQASCPGALPSRMKAGQPGKVIARNGTNARATPSVGGARVFGMPENAVFTVLDGPVCADGFAWWEVRYNDSTGWTAEGDRTDYWLQSLAPNLREVRFEDVIFAYDRALATGAYGGYTAPVRPAESLGLPAGVGFGFEGYVVGDAAFVVIYPAPEYEAQNPGSISGLEAALRAGTAHTAPDARWFPYTGVAPRVAGQARYFEFQSGVALRLLIHYPAPAPEPLTAESFFYVFLGLTDDGARFVQGFFPVRTALFPPQPSDSFDALSAIAYDAYLADSAYIVDRGGPGDFTPELRTLDTMLNTLQVMSSSSGSEDWLAVGYEGVRFALDPDLAPGARGESLPDQGNDRALPIWARTPAHIAFQFEGLGTAGGLPQLAVYPAQAYNLRFAGAIDELNAYLGGGLEGAEPPARLPIANARRALSAGVEPLDFNNGRGVRFLGYFSDATEYIVRGRGLAYVYLGLTDDGAQFVQMVVPVTARDLPAARPADFDFASFAAGYQQHLDETRRTLNTASARGFTPRLDQLDALIRSLEVR